MKLPTFLFPLFATVTGLVIAFIDSQPHWDDTGITVFMILFSSAIFTLPSSQKPWLIALAVGIWIPVMSIFYTHNYGGFIAIVPAFLGAYTVFFIYKNKR